MESPPGSVNDRRMLDLAARLAWRGVGNVEPNPLVGCVIGSVKHGGIVVLGMGHHRTNGGAHAEADALADCRRRGTDPRGATMWVTLEPCNHVGKTPPCSAAIIEAGIARVVIARADPNPVAAGGAEELRRAGVTVEFCNASRAAVRVSDAFVKRVTTGLPWVIAKWAQTMDGRIATRAGESKWISGEASRARVHRLRARVDAIVVGVGTVVADDPMLTARGVPRVRAMRRTRGAACRVVIDPSLRMPMECTLVRTAREAPVIVACDAAATADEQDGGARSRALKRAGVEVWEMECAASGFDVAALLRRLCAERGVTHALVEGGPTTLGRMLDADLVDEAWVFVAPMALGDERAPTAASGREAARLIDARRFALTRVRRVGEDAMLWFERARG